MVEVSLSMAINMHLLVASSLMHRCLLLMIVLDVLPGCLQGTELFLNPDSLLALRTIYYVSNTVMDHAVHFRD